MLFFYFLFFLILSESEYVDTEETMIRDLLKELSMPEIDTDSVKELMLCLDPQNIIHIIAAIMSEKQIVFVSTEEQR